ncbi:hypothetical protein D3C85_1789620 [compost metagenome]
MDHQEVRAFIEAVNRADFHAVGVFALDAVVGNDEGHGSILSSGGGLIPLCAGLAGALFGPRLRL